MTDAKAESKTTHVEGLVDRSPLRLHSSSAIYHRFGSTTLCGDSRPSWEQFDYADLWPFSGINQHIGFTKQSSATPG